PQVLPPHQQGGAAPSARGAARGSEQELEVFRRRPGRAKALVALRRRVRGASLGDEHQARAVVDHPGGPQVVPEPRRRDDHRRRARGARPEVSGAGAVTAGAEALRAYARVAPYHRPSSAMLTQRPRPMTTWSSTRMPTS